MNVEEALATADTLVFAKTGKYLSTLQAAIFRATWLSQKYEQIAQECYCSDAHVKAVGAALWELISEGLEEKVSKKTFRAALERRGRFSASGIVGTLPIQASQIQLEGELAHTSPRFNSPLLAAPELLDEQAEFSSTLYIERPPIESICYKTLLQPGSLIRIKAPKLMGKTSLITRVLAQLAQAGYRTASLSFELADRKTHLTNLNKFLRWLCLTLNRELRLPNQLDDYWDEEGMGSKVSCTTYFEEYLLVQADSPLVLCLDDVDLLFPYPEIYEDFFGLLRSWYEKARSRQLWQKLRLVIVHATDVYIRLNINQSPFNVGLPIELSEFTKKQARDFARQHGLEVDTALMERLMKMVGGHPYLLKQAFAHFNIHPDMTIDQLLTEAPTEAGIYRNHLREHWLNLQEHPELAMAFNKVVSATTPVQLEPMQAYHLQSMGLVKLSGNLVEPSYNLYRQYFSKRLEN